MNSVNYLIIFIMMYLRPILGKNINNNATLTFKQNKYLQNLAFFLFVILILTMNTKRVRSWSKLILKAITMCLFLITFLKLNAYNIVSILILYVLIEFLNKQSYNREQTNLLNVKKEHTKKMIEYIKYLIYFIIFFGFIDSYFNIKKEENISLSEYFFSWNL